MDLKLCLALVCLSVFFSQGAGKGVLNVDISDATEKSPVALKCSNDTGAFLWTYDGEKSNEEKETYNIQDPKLVGKYECNSSSVETKTFNAINYSMPSIEHTTKSIYATNGDVDLTLICHSNSYPKPQFSWFKVKEGEEKTEEKGVILSGSANYTITNGEISTTLLIKKVTFDTRAYYACYARNIAKNEKTMILVRVKDKLAPLYPALGIIAEIIVLAVIMLIVSKQAKKKAADNATGSPARTSNNRPGNSKED